MFKKLLNFQKIAVFLFFYFFLLSSLSAQTWTIKVYCAGTTGSCGSATISQNIGTYSTQSKCETAKSEAYCTFIYCPSECNGCSITSQSFMCVHGSGESQPHIWFENPGGGFYNSPYTKTMMDELGRTAAGLNNFAKNSNIGKETGTSSFSKHYSTEFEDWVRENHERNKIYHNIDNEPPTDRSRMVQFEYRQESLNYRCDQDFDKCSNAFRQQERFTERAEKEYLAREVVTSGAQTMVDALGDIIPSASDIGSKVGEDILGDEKSKKIAEGTEKGKEAYDWGKQWKECFDSWKKKSDSIDSFSKNAGEAINKNNSELNKCLDVANSLLEKGEEIFSDMNYLGKKVYDTGKRVIQNYNERVLNRAMEMINSANGCMRTECR
ncbi:MAG: hypothetical protein K6357_06825 [Elusimicrobiota bacterium]